MATVFPISRRAITMCLVLVWATMLLESAPIAAQETPTPTVVADCSGMEAYIDALRRIEGDYRAAFVAQLPGAPREWERPPGEFGAMTGLMEWTMWLTNANPEEIAILATLWATYAEQLRAIEPPPIAQAFHDEAVSNTQSLADVYRDEGSMAAMAMMLMGGLGGDPSTYALGLSEEAVRLAASCPAWAAYQGEVLATPLPS